MSKRHHNLFVGEKVFDLSKGYIGTIKSINDNEGGGKRDMLVVELEMDGWDEQENLKMFDCEIDENDLKWVSYSFYLYQFADGLVARDGNSVCYEHHKTRDNYPYYSPYLDENLFTFETFTKEEYENR